jgi:hypothetical protein
MRPTGKEIAFLNFLGYEEASTYTKDQAHDLISRLVEGDDAEIQKRCSEWQTARFALHPKLYSQDQEWMNETFHEPFRHFVRQRIAGASARLTHQRIADVIESLHEGNPVWWRIPNRNEVMFERLQVLHPQCCDGALPKPKVYVSRPKDPPRAALKPVKTGGCASVIAVTFAIVVGIYFFFQWL